jgi:GntR family transcriptional regulator
MARVWISPLTSSPLTSTQTKQYGFTVTTDKPVSGDDDGELSPIEFYLDRGSGVPTYLQLVHQVDYALRLGFLAVGDRLPRIKDVTRSLAVNPDTVMKAYRELELRGIAAGRPGLGTFILAVPEVAGLREMAALQRKLTAWLAEAGAAGVDELGMKALFAAALRDFHYGGGAGRRLPDREAGDRAGGVA